MGCLFLAVTVALCVSGLHLVSGRGSAPEAGDTDHQYYYADGYLSDWDPNQWQGASVQPHQPKCVEIPSDLKLCQNIDYTKMRLPNLLDHETMDEVKEQARAWVSLKNLQCHDDTQLFLCSLFSPVCLPRPIWPCRSLCESVKRGCESRMSKYGYPWPDMLRCDKFPVDNDMCIKAQGADKADDNTCEACSQPNTLEAIIDNYCSADFVMKIKVKEDVVIDDDVKLVSFSKNRAYKKGSLKKRDVKELTLYVEGGAQCDCNILETSNKKQYYLIMGNRKGKKLVASFVQVYANGGDMKKALRKIRKEKNICEGGAEVMKVTSESSEEEEEKKSKTDVNGEVAVKESRKGKKNRQGSKPRREKGSKRHKKERAGRRKKNPDTPRLDLSEGAGNTASRPRI